MGKHHANTNEEQDALRVADPGTTNFNANRIKLNHPNPSNKNVNYIEGGNIHRAGINNKTGMTSKGKPISAGCLLIDRVRIDEFNSIFKDKSQINNIVGIIVLR